MGSIAELKQEISELRAMLLQNEKRLSWIERVFESYGIRGLWLSPEKAAPLLGISRDRIMLELSRAENARANHRKSDLVYGTHYRNIQDVMGDRPSWQVQVASFDKILQIPPEQRKVS